MTRTIPRFIIVGTQKGGTTSLYAYLTKHPQILPTTRKEIHFFDIDFEKGIDWYLSQFPPIINDKYSITGEASPYYLFHPHVPQRLYRFFPETKLIVLLRNPGERAISHYYMELSRGNEYLSLTEAIAKESDRVDLEQVKIESDPSYYSIAHQRYSYLSRGLYLKQLQRWFDWFPQEQFLILKSEDLFAHPAAIVNQAFNFLELPEYELTEYRRYMAGNYGQIDREIKAALSEYFRPYNRQLEQYLDREFNWDSDSQAIANSDPIQAKQELCQKLTALSQVSPEQIRREIAPWQRLEIPNRPNTKCKKPNILLLMSDQHREDAMGCSGGWVRTTNLDRLAAEGIRFSNCITTSPVCIPTRLSLATGWYPHNTGIWGNCNYTLSPDSRTWMQVIRAQGYRTALFGKTHWHSQKRDLRDGLPLLNAYGFDEAIEVSGPRGNTWIRSQMTDEWEAAGLWQTYKDDFAERFRFCPQMVRPSPLGSYYYDVWVAGQACHYLESYSGDEPWFCWVSFPGPHEPWDAPEPYCSLYDPADMPVPAPIPTMEPNRPTGWFDEQITNPRVVLDESDPPQMRANYAGSVTLIDDQIGKILGVIQRRGELENTIIVYISDHGEMNGDCGLTYKGNFMKGSVRVPLLIRTPETLESAIAGSVYPHPVELLDVGPSLVELVGGTLDYPQFGKSLVSVLRDPNQLHREDALSEIKQEVMLLQGRWKVALNQQGRVYLLFDIENDPQETTNLAGRSDMMKIAAELRDRILERIKQSQVQSEI